jgi:hypothetical protein
MIISSYIFLVLGPRTVSRLSGSGWKKPFTLNLDEGTSDQAFLPSTSILHSPSGLLASPANLQLRPMMAMGSLAGSVPMPSMVCMVPLGNAAMKCEVKFLRPKKATKPGARKAALILIDRLVHLYRTCPEGDRRTWPDAATRKSQLDAVGVLITALQGLPELDDPIG